MSTKNNDLTSSGSSASKFIDGTDPLDAVYLEGNVGILTPDPTEALDVNGNLRVRQIPETAGSNDRILLPDATGKFEYQTINEGQIKLNSSGGVKPSYTGFVDNTPRIIQYNQGALNFSSSPTSQVPYNSSDFYDNATDQFLENPVEGSVNFWRVNYTYSGKANGNNMGVVIGFINPLSTFILAVPNTLPNGSNASAFLNFGGALGSREVTETAVLVTIADSLSIGTGYKLFVATTVNDGNFNITIDSVVRHNAIKFIR